MPLSRRRFSSDSKPIHHQRFHYDRNADHLWLEYTWPDSETNVGHAYWTIGPHTEEIHDVVGNRFGFNPVSHFTCDADFDGSVGHDFFDQNGSFISQLSECPLPISPEKFESWGVITHPSAASLSEWSVEAYNAFYDQVPTEVSVANFLYELKDIKGMIPKMEKTLSKTISSNFLAQEFGTLPFISDVKSILDLSESVNKRLQHLRDTQGKGTHLNFSRKLDAPENPDLMVPVQWIFEGSLNFRFRRVGYTGTFAVNGDLFQNLEGLNNPLMTWKAFAAAAGFNSPAKIVWAAIPYSFVVDWLFHVGNVIDSLKIQPFGGEWSVSNVGYSIKQEWIYDVYQSFCVPPNSEHLLGRVLLRTYDRVPGFPMSALGLTNGSLNPKQLVLSLAMLEQRRH